MPPIVPPKRQWYKRKLFWIPVAVILVVVAAAGAGYAYYVSLDKPQEKQVEQHDTDVKTVVKSSPHAFVYVSTAEKTAENCSLRTDTVHYMNLDSQKVTNVITLDDYQNATAFATYHDLVVFATTPSCGSKEGSTIWLSHDSGRTYKKIYATESKTGRITSIAFSTDGTEVAFGLLPAYDKPNSVKAINVDSTEVHNLFTGTIAEGQTMGVSYYVKSYDREKQRVYYVEGCYACDQTAPTNMLQYDLKSGKSSTVIERSENFIGPTPVINSDATRAVRVEFNRSDDSELTQSIVKEFDLATKKQVNFATYTGPTSAGSALAGYTADDSVYYTAGKKIITIAKNGATSELTQVPDQMSGVYYVGKTRVIYSINDQTGGGEVIDYDIKSGESTQLLKYEYPTFPLGVSYSVTRNH